MFVCFSDQLKINLSSCFNITFINACRLIFHTYTVRPYQVFYSKILATLLPVIYCKKPGKV